MINETNRWYSYPNSTDSESLYSFFNFINNTTDGLFFPVILLAIWFISFVGSYKYMPRTGASQSARAWVFSSFPVSVLSILTAVMGFLSSKYMYLSFILLAGGVLWLKISTPTTE